MSLLLLKTRDLTWQDHTLNTEVMLAPARSGLLLNKHKTLGAKCEMDKQLYERQRAQCVKDFLSSRRLIDRQRQKLINRQRELGSKRPRVRSAATAQPPAVQPDASGSTLKERSASAPGNLVNRSELPAIYIDTGADSPDPSDSSSFFVTELLSDHPPATSTPLPSFPTPARIASLPSAPVVGTRSAPGGRAPHVQNGRSLPGDRPNGKAARFPMKPTAPASKARGASTVSRPPGGYPTPTRKLGASSPGVASSSQRASSNQGAHRPSRDSLSLRSEPRQALSVRFAAELSPADENGDGDDDDDDNKKNDGKETMKDSSLEAKVRAFLDDINDFTVARRLGKETKKKPDLWPMAPKPEVTTPLVAKRYNSWSVDHSALLSAFDQFCSVQTPEELSRVMRLATKLKASVKVTRNQSIVPSIATFRSTRAFKTLLGKQG